MDLLCSRELRWTLLREQCRGANPTFTHCITIVHIVILNSFFEVQIVEFLESLATRISHRNEGMGRKLHDNLSFSELYNLPCDTAMTHEGLKKEMTVEGSVCLLLNVQS